MSALDEHARFLEEWVEQMEEKDRELRVELLAVQQALVAGKVARAKAIIDAILEAG